MNHLQVSVTFCDSVNIIHAFSITANPCACTSKLVFVGVISDKDQQLRR